MAESSGQIKVKAFVVLLDAAKAHHLVWRGTDATKEPSDFHRLLGGHVEFGETAEQAVVREVAEEVDAQLHEPRLLGVLENRFCYQNRPGHEVVFVYAGRLEPPDVIGEEGGTLYDNGEAIRVEWRPIDDVDCDVPLYPHGVGDLLPAARDAGP